MTTLFFKCVDEGDKQWFKAYCMRNNTTMSEVVKTFIRNLRKREERKEGE